MVNKEKSCISNKMQWKVSDETPNEIWENVVAIQLISKYTVSKHDASAVLKELDKFPNSVPKVCKAIFILNQWNENQQLLT